MSGSIESFDARCSDAEDAIRVALNDMSGTRADRWRRIAAAERALAGVYRAAQEHVAVRTVVWSALYDAEQHWLRSATQAESDAATYWGVAMRDTPSS